MREVPILAREVEMQTATCREFFLGLGGMGLGQMGITYRYVWGMGMGFGFGTVLTKLKHMCGWGLRHLLLLLLLDRK